MYYQPINQQQAALFDAIIFQNLPEIQEILDSYPELLLCTKDTDKHRSPFIISIELAIEINSLPVIKIIAKDAKKLLDFQSIHFDGDLINYAITHARPIINIDLLSHILDIYKTFNKPVHFRLESICKILESYPQSKEHIKLLSKHGIDNLYLFNKSLEHFKTHVQLHFLKSIAEDLANDLEHENKDKSKLLRQWLHTHIPEEWDKEKAKPQNIDEINGFILFFEQASTLASNLFEECLTITSYLNIEEIAENILNLVRLYKTFYRKKLEHNCSKIIEHILLKFNISKKILFMSLLAAEIDREFINIKDTFQKILDSINESSIINISWNELCHFLDLHLRFDFSIPNQIIFSLRSLNIKDKLFSIQTLLTIEDPLSQAQWNSIENNKTFMTKRKDIARTLATQILPTHLQQEIPEVLAKIEKFVAIGYLLPEFIKQTISPLIKSLNIIDVTKLNPIHAGSYFVFLCKTNHIEECFKIIEIIGFADKPKKYTFIKNILEDILHYLKFDKDQKVRLAVLLAIHELIIEIKCDDHQINQLHWQLVDMSLHHNIEETNKLLKSMITNQIVDFIESTGIPSYIKNAVKLMNNMAILKKCIAKFFPKTCIKISKLMADIIYHILQNIHIAIENIDQIKHSERLLAIIKIMELFTAVYHGDFKEIFDIALQNDSDTQHHLEDVLSNLTNRIAIYVCHNISILEENERPKHLEHALKLTFIHPSLNKSNMITSTRTLIAIHIAEDTADHKDSLALMKDLREGKILADTFSITWSNLCHPSDTTHRAAITPSFKLITDRDRGIKIDEESQRQTADNYSNLTP